MRWVIATALLAVGCGSSWQIRKGDALPYGCEERLFYADGDGDGWGDPTSEAVSSCQPEAGLDASNGRDCDDADPTITGRVGSICPDGLVAGAALEFAGVLGDAVEFVYVYGDTSVTRYTMAAQACEGWSGSDQDEGGAWFPRGSLATFGSRAEMQLVQDGIEAVVPPGGTFAGFIGVEWDGSLADSDAWSWTDDSDDGLFGQIGFCGGVPAPEDFFPNLNPDDPDHAGGLNAELDKIRIAMVLQENGAWCLGLPIDAVPPGVENAVYSTTDAHFVCERPEPDTEEYEEFVPAE